MTIFWTSIPFLVKNEFSRKNHINAQTILFLMLSCNAILKIFAAAGIIDFIFIYELYFWKLTYFYFFVLEASIIYLAIWNRNPLCFKARADSKWKMLLWLYPKSEIVLLANKKTYLSNHLVLFFLILNLLCFLDFNLLEFSQFLKKSWMI